MSAETDEIIECFVELLRGPTGDGKAKRDAGTKPFWKVDDSHRGAMLRHLGRWWNGETIDPESGCHPLAHMAWRALAVAYQETHPATDGINQQAFWDEIAAAAGDHDPARQYIEMSWGARLEGEDING